MLSPSRVTSLRTKVIVTSACRIWLVLSLPIRTIRVGLPLKGLITATRLNRTRAVGRETRAKSIPVVSATNKSPQIASAVISVLA